MYPAIIKRNEHAEKDLRQVAADVGVELLDALGRRRGELARALPPSCKTAPAAGCARTTSPSARTSPARPPAGRRPPVSTTEQNGARAQSNSRSSPRTSPRSTLSRNTPSTTLLRQQVDLAAAAQPGRPTGTRATVPPRLPRGTKPTTTDSWWKSSPFETSEARRLMYAFVFQAHLAAEEAVDDDEVDGGEDHPDAPPDEPDGLAVVGGGGVVDGEAVGRVDRGQHVRVDARRRCWSASRRCRRWRRGRPPCRCS